MNNNEHSRRDLLSFLGIAATWTLLPIRAYGDETAKLDAYPDNIPHTVAQCLWPVTLGSHRIRIHVENRAEAVVVCVPWRRIDKNPGGKAILITDTEGNLVVNVLTLQVRQDAGVLLFEAGQPGDYFVYYLPHAESKNETEMRKQMGAYRTPEWKGDASWRCRYASTAVPYPGKRWDSLPKARVIEFQARTAHDSFWPMEVAATEDEIEALCRKVSDPVLVFVEDREHPIKMLDKLPYRWIQRGPQNRFNGEAFRGEFYLFQLGFYGNVLTLKSPLAVSVDCSGLHGEVGEISASAWWSSRSSRVPHEAVTVSAGALQVLWCGVQIPLAAVPGAYSGQIDVKFGENRAAVIEFEVEVNQQFLRAGGDDEPWRLSRLKWLDSTIGTEGTVTAPYMPVEVQDQTVNVLGHAIEIGQSGLPISITAKGQEILNAPISLNVYKSSRAVEWKGACKRVVAEPAKVTFSSEGHGDGYDVHVQSTIEFDGALLCKVTLTSKRHQTISDIALEIPYIKDRVPYAVAMGLSGGERPQRWKWTWAEQPDFWKEQGIDLGFFCWLGNVGGGLYCRLKSPLDEWKNRNRGSVSIHESQNQVLLRISCGPRELKACEVVHLTFHLLPTPVKPLNKDHWQYRYAHAYEPASEAKSQGATVINVHHGMLPNRYINYPFLNIDLLVPYIESAHALGIKVKLYYTMRELTTQLPELWAFRSLGNEIYAGPGVQGMGDQAANFWVQEHVRTNYSSGWVQPLPFGGMDTSLRIDSKSRLANFYLEGLRWLIEVPKIDGLYLDEIGYGRDTMQRVRRVLDQRAGTMIDMHANHQVWSCNCPIGYYMEHLPYIDRLWFGEAFDPDSPPDFWLIEMSGLPFGLSSDMLERPNPWRGMLFGMTSRAHYAGSGSANPTSIWRLWESFGIQDAKVIGWWDKERLVDTNRKDVLATAYQREGKCLLAIASWAKSSVPLRLKINWDLIGFKKEGATITAPNLEGLQESRVFSLDGIIPVRPGQGWLLLLECQR